MCAGENESDDFTEAFQEFQTAVAELVFQNNLPETLLMTDEQRKRLTADIRRKVQQDIANFMTSQKQRE